MLHSSVGCIKYPYMEPSTSSAAGLTLAVGTVSLVGTLFGMHYDALLFGLFGGLIFLSRSPKVSRSQAVSGVLASALLAGTFANATSVVLGAYYPVLHQVGGDPLRRAFAMMIGSGWQVVVPVVFGVLKQWLAKVAGSNTQESKS